MADWFTALVLMDGNIISEKDEGVTITAHKDHYFEVTGTHNTKFPRVVVTHILSEPNPENLPCSTPSLLLSSCVSSAPAGSCPTKNTPQAPPLASLCEQELYTSLTALATSMLKLLVVLSTKGSTGGASGDKPPGLNCVDGQPCLQGCYTHGWCKRQSDANGTPK
jgi:hypothetical protein